MERRVTRLMTTLGDHGIALPDEDPVGNTGANEEMSSETLFLDSSSPPVKAEHDDP